MTSRIFRFYLLVVITTQPSYSVQAYCLHSSLHAYFTFIFTFSILSIIHFIHLIHYVCSLHIIHCIHCCTNAILYFTLLNNSSHQFSPPLILLQSIRTLFPFTVTPQSTRTTSPKPPKTPNLPGPRPPNPLKSPIYTDHIPQTL